MHMRVCLKIGACTKVHVHKRIFVRETEKELEVIVTWQMCVCKFLTFAKRGSGTGQMHQQLAYMFAIHAEEQQRMMQEMKPQLHERQHAAFMQVFVFC